jgi:hypothetical protein
MAAINEPVDPFVAVHRFLNEQTESLAEKRTEGSYYKQAMPTIANLTPEQSKALIQAHADYKQKITKVFSEVSQKLQDQLGSQLKPEDMATLQNILNLVKPKQWSIGSEAEKARGIIQTVQQKLEDIQKKPPQEPNIIA